MANEKRSAQALRFLFLLMLPVLRATGNRAAFDAVAKARNGYDRVKARNGEWLSGTFAFCLLPIAGRSKANTALLGYTAALRASTLSVFSQGRSRSGRPK